MHSLIYIYIHTILCTCDEGTPIASLRSPALQARAMAETGTAPNGLVSELMSVVRSHGVKGLWAGWAPISLRAISASVSMTAYESLK